MLTFIKTFAAGLLVWEAAVASAIAIMYALAHRAPEAEARPWLISAFSLGLFVVSACVMVCRRFRPLYGTVIGFSLGLVIPVLMGWLWGRATEPWVFSWRYPLSGLDAWIEGLQLSIPSAIAGGIIGYLQARNNARRPFSLESPHA